MKERTNARFRIINRANRVWLIKLRYLLSHINLSIIDANAGETWQLLLSYLYKHNKTFVHGKSSMAMYISLRLTSWQASAPMSYVNDFVCVTCIHLEMQRHAKHRLHWPTLSTVDFFMAISAMYTLKVYCLVFLFSFLFLLRSISRILCASQFYASLVYRHASLRL